MAGASEDTWVGGAAAVLVATLTSAAAAPPAERLEPLLALLVAIVRETGGEADRATPDGIVAAFPSVAAGVAAAFEIHRHVFLGARGFTR